MNPWKQLNPAYMKGLTPDVVDDVFIARMFFCADDYLTPRDMVGFFVQYPGLDTLESVWDKTFECMKKTIEKEFMECTNLAGKQLNIADIVSYKSEIYAIMDRDYEPGADYNFMFDITKKGYEFMKATIWEYQPIYNELIRLTNEDDN